MMHERPHWTTYFCFWTDNIPRIAYFCHTTSSEQPVSHLFILFKLHCISQETHTSACIIDSFHWILFVIALDLGKVFIYDTLRKKPELYVPMIHIIHEAWALFHKKHGEKFRENLFFHHDFPVCVLFAISCYFFQYNK